MDIGFADSVILKSGGRYAKRVPVIFQTFAGMGPDGIRFGKGLPRFFRQFEGAIHHGGGLSPMNAGLISRGAATPSPCGFWLILMQSS